MSHEIPWSPRLIHPIESRQRAARSTETRPGVTAFASDLPHFILEEIGSSINGYMEVSEKSWRYPKMDSMNIIWMVFVGEISI